MFTSPHLHLRRPELVADPDAKVYVNTCPLISFAMGEHRNANASPIASGLFRLPIGEAPRTNSL